MIESLLPLHPTLKRSYELKMNDGTQLLNKSSITIISLVRDVERVLETNINTVVAFFEKYGSKINYVFFENDSIDDTKNILQKYKKIYPNKLHVISQNFDRQLFGPVKSEERIKALSEYRNTAKQYASGLESDFVIVLDMDFDEIRLDGLLNSFGWFHTESSITAIAGNSFQYRPGLYSGDPSLYNLWNYDSWAFRHNWWLDLHNNLPAPENTIDPMFWFGCWIPPTGSSPITVNSAFGGCAIYRSNIYFHANYDYMDCEHVCFHYNLYANKDLNFRLVLNPSQQMIFKL